MKQTWQGHVRLLKPWGGECDLQQHFYLERRVSVRGMFVCAVFVCVCVHVCVCESVSVHAHANVCVCLCMCMCVSGSVHVCVCAHAHVCMCVCNLSSSTSILWIASCLCVSGQYTSKKIIKNYDDEKLVLHWHGFLQLYTALSSIVTPLMGDLLSFQDHSFWTLFLHSHVIETRGQKPPLRQATASIIFYAGIRGQKPPLCQATPSIIFYAGISVRHFPLWNPLCKRKLQQTLWVKPVQLSSVQDDIYLWAWESPYRLHSVSQKFPSIAFEAVPVFAWVIWPGCCQNQRRRSIIMSKGKSSLRTYPPKN